MTWADLPAKLKAYIILLICCAAPITLWAAWDLITTEHNSGWIVLTVLTLLTVRFFLYLPSVNATIAIGDAYIMAIAMMYGIAPCVAATFFQTLILSIFAKRPRIPFYRILFNISSMIFGAWLYSTIYYALNRGSVELSEIIVPAVVLVTSYFFINTILTSIAIAWANGGSVIKFWVKACMPLTVDFSISAVAATGIVALYSFNEYIPLAAAPLIGFVWGWNKLNKTRVMEAERHLKDQEDLYLRTVESLALAVDAKDQTTYGHIRRVKVYAMGLAKLCGIKDPSELMAIETGSLLHDIGKLAIDDYILNKPGRLSKQEFEKMKVHATAGDEILQQVRFPFPVAKYVRYHHERWDGLGYPDGIKGEEIPLGARILAIADAFDAIRFSRPYKLSIAIDEALELLRDQSGAAYDPNLVMLFINHIEELEQAAIKESANMPDLSFRKHFEIVDSTSSAAIDDISLANPIMPSDVPSELVQLAEFCNTIARNLSLNDIYPIIGRRIERLVPYSTFALYLDNGEDSVQAVYVNGKSSEFLQKHKIGMGKGISGWVAAHRRHMMNTGPALDFQGLDEDLSFFTDSLVVPILLEDESIGTISLYSDESTSYNQSHLNIMQTLASILSPLIAASKKRDGAISDNFIDPTTQIHRVAYLAAIGPRIIASAAKSRTPTSLIYLEIQNFYQIVRLYGVHVGNSIIRRIADCLRLELRESDRCA